MRSLRTLKQILFSILFTVSIHVFAQIQPGIYVSENENETHELKIDSSYFIHTVYEKSPARFIKTAGGFYTAEADLLQIALEFHSNFELDSITTLSLPFKVDDGTIKIKGNSEMTFEKQPEMNQDLDGQWLFATRGPDKGQERRGDANTRKTLKFLMDGHFQWIAFDTDGMQFKGTGGGSYTSENGIYTENIEFFSRDDNRVGASLEFKYETKGTDWHHTGNTSKGKPMYEIWGKRLSNLEPLQSSQLQQPYFLVKNPFQLPHEHVSLFLRTQLPLNRNSHLLLLIDL